MRSHPEGTVRKDQLPIWSGEDEDAAAAEGGADVAPDFCETGLAAPSLSERWTRNVKWPTTNSSPSLRRASLTREPFKKVPLLLPRSVRWQPSRIASKAQWLLDRNLSSGNEQLVEGARPMTDFWPSAMISFLPGEGPAFISKIMFIKRPPSEKQNPHRE